MMQRSAKSVKHVEAEEHDQSDWARQFKRVSFGTGNRHVEVQKRTARVLLRFTKQVPVVRS